MGSILIVKMAQEPARGVADDHIQRAGLLEQMVRAGNDHELARTMQMTHRRFVEFDHRHVAPPHDQQGRRPDARQCGSAGEIGPAAA